MPSGHGTREVNWPAVTGYIFAGASGAGFSFTVLYLAAWGSPSRARRGQWRQVTKLQARRALAVAGPSVTRALHGSQGEVSAHFTRHECAPAVRLYTRLQLAVTVCLYTVNTCADFFTTVQGNTFSRQQRRRTLEW
jgi:hypothetical protein